VGDALEDVEVMLGDKELVVELDVVDDTEEEVEDEVLDDVAAMQARS
jgi:hypothetical protein